MVLPYTLILDFRTLPTILSAAKCLTLLPSVNTKLCFVLIDYMAQSDLLIYRLLQVWCLCLLFQRMSSASQSLSALPLWSLLIFSFFHEDMENCPLEVFGFLSLSLLG